MFSIQKLSTDKLRFNTIFTGAVDLFIAMWLLVDIEFVANIPYLQNMEYIKFAKCKMNNICMRQGNSH